MNDGSHVALRGRWYVTHNNPSPHASHLGGLILVKSDENLLGSVAICGFHYSILNLFGGINRFDSTIAKRSRSKATRYLPNYLGWRCILDAPRIDTPDSMLRAAIGCFPRFVVT
jgi:hypothetical protein